MLILDNLFLEHLGKRTLYFSSYMAPFTVKTDKKVESCLLEVEEMLFNYIFHYL